MTDDKQAQRDGDLAMAGYLAATRYKDGDDRKELEAACLHEVETDPYYDQFRRIAAAAPPPDTWEPGFARDLRRIIRGARPKLHCHFGSASRSP